eukprot:19539-Heterococcus_DN1.PRE.2
MQATVATHCWSKYHTRPKPSCSESLQHERFWGLSRELQVCRRAAMPAHSNTTPERLEGWESLDRGSTAAPEPVLKQGYESAQALPGE